ncbi:hypothetical protein [Streptomyces sp. SID161]|uniref:hypothetical protein n=1 Tax=Streptomyces sp. SID161 TaxID=2690251 RepID=UPI00137018D1|nr:hypothetical protein [Streptomyces sp. SID161]MYW46369.1 hypothetical protein [Streptomyces sp. SID161]
MAFGLRDLETILARPVQPPIPGQQAISVGSIWDHVYEGPGACRAELFGQTCRAHRDEHQHTGEGP